MKTISRAFDPEHPLLTDRKRLDRIADVMYAKIHKTLFLAYAGHRQSDEPERVLEGTAVSANDVLAVALAELLQYPPERLEGSWEALALMIARNKAVDALRASETGLRGTEHRPQLRLVSGDAERESSSGEIDPPLFEVLSGNWGDPAEFAALEDAFALRDLARDVLDERAREIFFAIHFLGFSRREVGEQVGLTGQRIGQIYRAALRTLEGHPDYPFKLDE